MVSVLHLYQRLVSVCVYESVFSVQSVFALGRGMAAGLELRATAAVSCTTAVSEKYLHRYKPITRCNGPVLLDTVLVQAGFFHGQAWAPIGLALCSSEFSPGGEASPGRMATGDQEDGVMVGSRSWGLEASDD